MFKEEIKVIDCTVRDGGLMNQWQFSEKFVRSVYTALAQKYMERLPGKTIGAHFHNNQQLAFANTISAIINGVNFLDATLYGIGRGAGNCPLELLLSFLKNPKFRVRPIIHCIEEEIFPWSEKIDWGYSIPYMVTGTMNQHPRTAMAVMESENKDNILEYYDTNCNVVGSV